MTEQWFDTVMVNRWPSVNVVARGHAKVARWIEEPGELARRLKGKMPEWGGPSVWGTPGTAEDKPGDHAIGLFWYHTDAKPNAALKAFLNLAAFYGASVVELRVACSGVGSWKGRIERVFMFDVILAPASRGRTRSRVRRWVLSLVPDRDRSPSLIEAQIPDFVPFIMPNGRPTANWPTSNMIPMEQGKAPEVPMRARGRRRDARGQVGEQGGAL